MPAYFQNAPYMDVQVRGNSMLWMAWSRHQEEIVGVDVGLGEELSESDGIVAALAVVVIKERARLGLV